jgi:ankyrin repeat protein
VICELVVDTRAQSIVCDPLTDQPLHDCAGAQLQVKDGSGNTPLHYAAKAGKVDLVKYLVSKGADVSSRNSHRHTPYDVATNHIIRQYLLPLQLRVCSRPTNTDHRISHVYTALVLC